MKPVYEFRPLPDYFGSSFKRYNNGLWIPDDGEYDLAFIGKAREGWPLCLYVSMQYYENIICSWRSGHCLCVNEAQNGWHYALKAGTDGWIHRMSYDEQTNEIASKSGMYAMSSEAGCCNGRSISFQFHDKHIAAGLVRDRDTKQVFEWDDVRCHYCGKRPVQEERIKALKYAVARHNALRRLNVAHPVFDECDCVKEVIEQSLICG